MKYFFSNNFTCLDKNLTCWALTNPLVPLPTTVNKQKFESHEKQKTKKYYLKCWEQTVPSPNHFFKTQQQNNSKILSNSL